jgi:hypothetical protein
MRVRSLALAVAIVIAGCVHNPDPRGRNLEEVQRRGRGGWIVVTMADGAVVEGELISVERTAVRVLTVDRLHSLAPAAIRRASLYTYESEGGFGGWGLLGTVSTISHGLFLILSAPVWVLTSGITASVESSHVELEPPDDSWAELATWARFPQGMPPGIGEDGLIRMPGRPPGWGATLTKREQAWALTREAAAAARRGECARVSELDGKVAVIDADFHATVFRPDAAIARCLAPTPAPAP